MIFDPYCFPPLSLFCLSILYRYRLFLRDINLFFIKKCRRKTNNTTNNTVVICVVNKNACGDKNSCCARDKCSCFTRNKHSYYVRDDCLLCKQSLLPEWDSSYLILGFFYEGYGILPVLKLLTTKKTEHVTRYICSAFPVSSFFFPIP